MDNIIRLGGMLLWPAFESELYRMMRACIFLLVAQNKKVLFSC